MDRGTVIVTADPANDSFVLQPAVDGNIPADTLIDAGDATILLVSGESSATSRLMMAVSAPIQWL